MANITNSTQNKFVSGTSEADLISNSGAYASIYGYEGNDTINNNDISHWSYIDGGAGNDYIYSYMGDYLTIRGGTGNDTISFKSLYSNDHVIQYNSGDGNDYIEDTWGTPRCTLQIGGGTGTYSTQMSGSDKIVTVGDGKITLAGAMSTVSIEGTYVKTITADDIKSIELSDSDDEFDNTISDITITAGAGDDTIFNTAPRVTIYGGTGNDSIYNAYSSTSTASSSYIHAGDGNDIIRNAVYGGDYTTVNGGAGNDTLENRGSWSSISGSSGDDSILSTGYSMAVTINPGAGSDTVSLDSVRDQLIQYANGDGNDIIYGFRSTTTLNLSNANYSSQISGSDTLIKVGTGTITIKNYTDTVNITGGTLISGGVTLNNENANTLLNGTDYADSIYSDADNVTISSGSGNDTLSVAGGKASITIGNGNNFVYFYANAYNPTVRTGSDSDSIDSGAQGALINTGAGNDSVHLYSNATNHEIFLFGGNDSIYSGGQTATIYCGEGNDYVYLYDNATNHSIYAVDGDDSIDSGCKVAYINMGAGNDYVHLYNNATKHTISAAEGADKLYIDGPDNSIYGGAGNDYIHLYNSSLATGNTISTGTGDDTVRSYNTNGVLYQYASGDGADIFYGFTTKDTLQITGEKYSSLKSGDDLILTVGDGKISLIGAADLSTVNIKGNKVDNNSWKLSGTTATYGTASNTLITVKGVKSLDGISLSGTTVTISKASLGTKKVTISSGYNLALGDDVSGSSTKKAWSFKNATATYNQTTTAGYSLKNNAITYTKKATKTLVTVNGVTSTDGLKINDKVVTVSKASLGTSKVTISSGYTLKLGDDANSSSSKKVWSLSKTTATYKQTTAAGYSLKNNAITYTKKATKTLVTVKGVKSTDGLKISDKVVTVSKASLGTSKVTISSGYTLKLGDDVSSSSTKKAWSLNKTTATYKQTTAAGYSLKNNAITYTKKATKTLATIKGVTSKSGLKVSGKTIKPAASSLSNKVTVSSDGYEFSFASGYKNAKITGSTGNDTIKSAGSKVTIDGGKGNDILSGGSGADTFVYSLGDGNDIITNYDTADRISIESGTENISTSGKDVIFTVSSGKKKGTITVQNGNGKTITYFDANGKERVYPQSSDDVKFNADGTTATLTVKYTKDSFNIADYAEHKDLVVTINAAAVKHGLEITGNKQANKITGTSEDDYIDGGASSDKIYGKNGNDTLVGSKGNDLLNGGAGDDSLWGGVGTDTLTGGDGADIFVYNSGDGNNIITDYESNIDKIMVTSGLVGDYIADSSDVTFEVSGGQILVQNGADKHIRLVDSSGNLLKHYSPKSKS